MQACRQADEGGLAKAGRRRRAGECRQGKAGTREAQVINVIVLLRAFIMLWAGVGWGGAGRVLCGHDVMV